MTFIQLDLNDRSVRNEVLRSSVLWPRRGAWSVWERGAEESLMLGVRWCLIVQRLGLSNCDWVHPPQSEGQGKSEKLKSHNQVFYASGLLGAVCATRPSATAAPVDVTQVISPQLYSAHAHSQDGNHARLCLCPWSQSERLVVWIDGLQSAYLPFCFSTSIPSLNRLFLSVFFYNPLLWLNQTWIRICFILTERAPVILVKVARYIPLMCVWFVLVCVCACVFMSAHVCLRLLIWPAHSRH